FSCAYLTNLAWSGPTTFLPKETNPKAVFDRLIKGGLPSAPAATAPATIPTAAAADKSLIYQKNILDLVAADTADLKRRLGRSDQVKLTDYLDSVNELQRRVAAVSGTMGGTGGAPGSGAGGAPGSGAGGMTGSGTGM